MSLAATLTLKKDDNTTAEDFVTVDQAPNLPGTLRADTSIDLPASQSLLIRSQTAGSKSNRAKRHTLSMNKTVSDGVGGLSTGSASLSLVYPDSTGFTAQHMIDMIHQLLDVIISTATFDVDDSVVKAILRGES